jgi:hypothetical protein
VNDFLHGALVMASLAIGLFFFRYWRSTRDRLFWMFGAAFWLLAFNWTLASHGGQLAPHAYLFRFSAFVLIAIAVLDKNRRQGGKK